MKSIVFVVPGSIDSRTGGYEYDRRIIAGMRAHGWNVDVVEVDESFPHPTSAASTRVANVLADLPDRAIVVVDGLAFGAMPSVAEREASRLRLVALVHAPLAAEPGLDPQTSDRLKATERRSLAAAALIIVTGHTTVGALAEYGVARDRIAVVEPGTDAAPIAKGSGDPKRLHLVSAATINPGKGHEVLLQALALNRHFGWRLSCAGSTDRHPPTVDRVRAVLSTLGLESRVSLLGELDDAEMKALYDSADLFVLATLHESYGMAVAEALAHGLPVISTTTGAIPDLVPPDAGILVPPGDVAALADALSAVLGNPRAHARLAEGARRVRPHLPTWEDATKKMIAAIDGLEG